MQVGSSFIHHRYHMSVINHFKKFTIQDYVT
jgi:hypothetical protein